MRCKGIFEGMKLTMFFFLAGGGGGVGGGVRSKVGYNFCQYFGDDFCCDFLT